jgi:RNA recognition motif-containing protein
MKNIFVGNLSFGTTEEAVRALFEPYGTVDRVNICTDRDTGQARGFGFVEMSNDGEGEKAIAAVNGVDLGGRTLNVNEARPKTDRGFGGGGGGGNRSGGGGGRKQRW